MYKIGITEAGDAGIDLHWADKLDSVDAAVVITKNITPGFTDIVMQHKDKLIVHATVTGYGGTVLEPNVPAAGDSLSAAQELIARGFPKDKSVIRIDPIIPTRKGIQRACGVFNLFTNAGFSRFRISVIDMYPHVRQRFKEAGLTLPYGDDGFQPNEEQLKAVDSMIENVLRRSPRDVRIESCAEPGLRVPIHCGCISEYDLSLLGLREESDDGSAYPGYQRKNCMCYAGKTELLSSKKQCPNRCLYCYWK